jgi:hypothetical protein
MPKLLLVIFILLLSLGGFAQKRLLFYNAKTLRTIELKEGHKASILYKGYLGQPEFFIQMVTHITDSTIVLGTNRSSKLFGKSDAPSAKTIRISDILGFRRMTVGRQLAQAGVSIAGVVGSYILIRNLYASNINPTGAFFISLGTGYGIIGITRLLFPENIKYHMEEGWQVKVIED